MFRHDTRAMLFLLPRMVLDAVSSRDETRIAHVRVEITAVLNDAAGVEGDQAASHAHAAQKSTQGEQAELAAQTVFTLLDQLTAWRDDAASREANGFVEGTRWRRSSTPSRGNSSRARRFDAARPRARFCTLRSTFARRKRHEPGGASKRRSGGGRARRRGGFFLAATHRGLAEPDALEAVARLRSRCGAGGSGAVAAAAARGGRAPATRAGWRVDGGLTHYESALQRGGERHGRGHGRGDASERHPDGVGPGDGSQPPRSNPRRGSPSVSAGARAPPRVGARGGGAIAQRPAARGTREAGRGGVEIGTMGFPRGFLGVLDANAGGGAGIAQGAGGFGGADGRPGGEAAVGRRCWTS